MELGAGEPLSFPEGLTDVLNVYDELLHPQRDRFLRACHWVKLANELFLQSFSAAFMAIITAAETLFPAPQLPDCGSCGQPRYGLRQAFGTFLEDHVPLAYLTSSGFEDVPSFVARLKDLYDTRSAITHGGALRGWEAPTSGFTPQTNQDDSDLRTLVRIMPYALGAWLCQIPRGAPDD